MNAFMSNLEQLEPRGNAEMSRTNEGIMITCPQREGFVAADETGGRSNSQGTITIVRFDRAAGVFVNPRASLYKGV
ncbi:hypothetical protein ACFQI7_36825 [Paenibacillus allorhizosphaerae]|uniref:Uncharacterized protein n=1 Tax=Paenibacillus allorhizosphaerae TaxID=2849866 RepID=A0ABM8VUQ4_9BACL|nr:hypothetical protein [Paenibacillus allorhizosphaerae]CAG7659052.1 hypothetical protein PAECIP111802_07304 [Paenibacillus allorhizosphaerae]